MFVTRALARICKCTTAFGPSSQITNKISQFCKIRVRDTSTWMIKQTKTLNIVRELHAGPCRLKKKKAPVAKKDPKTPAKNKPNKCGDDEKAKSNEKEKQTINQDPCRDANRAAVLYTKGDLRLEKQEKLSPCPGDVLIAMDSVALSTQDVNYYTDGQFSTPLILGRDGTGVIAQLGKGVRKFREGDRVVIEPDISCRECEFCRECKYHLCCHAKSCGTFPYNGILQCFHTHPAEYCHKLPDNTTMEEGALLGMLATGINVCSRCPLCIGSSLLVVGAGATGLTAVAVAKAMGATNTCVMCKFKDRLELAKQLNTKTVQIADGASPEDMAQMVRDEMGCAPVITVDSVGSEISMKLAVASTASGGSIVLAGASAVDPKIQLTEIAERDLSLRSALRHSNKFPAALALLDSGAINTKFLISHHFFFEETAKAFETYIANRDTVNKVLIHMGPRDKNNKQPF